ncbi:MAG: PAS domain S-box protein, partial [Methanomicrobiaceae archaeon]|nr:PAS domain S-box protein [Methanomicrobiaceae archaeon]
MHTMFKTFIRSFITPVHIIDTAIAAIILLMLYLLSEKNYLLFHGIIELFSIAISFSIFILVWNSRKLYADLFFLIIGISFLFTGSIDLVHTLAYKGMGVFPDFTADLPTQLWIAARYFQSITFLIATLFIGKTITKDRKYDVAIVFTACAAVCSLFFASIFIWQDFPHCFIEGSGLTPFKIYSEYLISLILIATAVILYKKRQLFDSEVWRFLIAAQLFLIMGEFSFTTYVNVYGFTNMLGHLFKLVSFYFFYRAIIVVGLTRPYDLILRDLVENINDVIFTTDVQGKITYISPAVERMCGFTSEEMTGQDFIRYVHPEDHPIFTAAIKPKENVENKETEFRIIRRDGSV